MTNELLLFLSFRLLFFVIPNEVRNLDRIIAYPLRFLGFASE